MEEHRVVDGIVVELDALSVSDETWGAKATVMGENVEHHMEEGDEDMFKKARAILDEDELAELGTGWKSESANCLATESPERLVGGGAPTGTIAGRPRATTGRTGHTRVIHQHAA